MPAGDCFGSLVLARNAILERMLERLYASMARGPTLNCRPHSSRQRVDLMTLTALQDAPPHRVLVELLGEGGRATICGRVAPPPGFRPDFRPSDDAPADSPQSRDWMAQRRLLTKLRNLSDDARTYENDTGVHALAVGYPLLSLPPGATGASGRVLAPLAFVPVTLSVRTGHRPGVDIACKGEGIDRVGANEALLAWLSRQLGRPVEAPFHDEEGLEPWREIEELVRCVAQRLQLSVPNLDLMLRPESLSLEAVPLAEALDASAAVYASAVLGLFPMANQALLRDTREMLESGRYEGPVRSFVEAGVALDAPAAANADDLPHPEAMKSIRRFAAERLVAQADPFQSRSVAAARTAGGLVIHGPPGTGKSQTITNIIGDHLSRGQRVLFVCEKRTALDVVRDRLAHLGLGGLCAVVHDPQRDQRDLYMSIRAELEALTDVKTAPRSPDRVEKIDAELQAMHDELLALHRLLMDDDEAGGPSLHACVGQWLGIERPSGAEGLDERALREAPMALLARHEAALQLILRRGVAYGHATNPWPAAAGLSLASFLARPAEELRAAAAGVAEQADAVDATRHDRIPSFAAEPGVIEQAAVRTELAAMLERIQREVPAESAARWADADAGEVTRWHGRLRDADPHRRALATPLDSELAMTAREAPPKISTIARQLATLDAYRAIATRWYAFFCFGARGAAKKSLAAYGLPHSPDAAARLDAFLRGWRSRVVLGDLATQLTGAAAGSPMSDEALGATLDQHELVLSALVAASAQPALDQALRQALKDPKRRPDLIEGLRRSDGRARAMAAFMDRARQTGLFHGAWLEQWDAALRNGGAVQAQAKALAERYDALEEVLRNREELQKLPEALRDAVAALLSTGLEPDAGLDAIRHGVLAGQIVRRISASEALRSLDPARIEATMQRYRELEQDKRRLVRDAILHQWKSRQRERLLASTGNRLSSDGAALRQRLFVRGARAMRLRQVVAVGESIEGGDPLFDMCPVWMASPETVAQVFPRQPIFDVLIFDEASQLKLEEALPVLTRARRVVIAGDPRQLPPTRFFESGVSDSDEGELLSEQDVFDAQQSEIEDLLTAALNLSIEQSYLDVHYRSRHEDLIAFSNEHFYGSRLQALPGHPRNRPTVPPVQMHRVDGVYEDRCNPAEADRVVELTVELLSEKDPPSIGIACFNLAQRDLILELLDERAEADEAFARRLAAARERRGEGSFEGLFVKNLESVQGDERDHIIISTTFGPNREGRFFRRFGPLGQAGGWRRLNVLITRAKHRVHLVTSIPREAYVGALPAGANLHGGWMLLAYLRFAEALAGTSVGGAAVAEATVRERPIDPVSPLAMALARRLARERGLGSVAHWGNEGFRIDVAVDGPGEKPGTAIPGAAGILCDMSAFADAPDPVEWELFRSGILAGLGWRVQRWWSPQVFRDPQRVLHQIAQGVSENASISEMRI